MSQIAVIGSDRFTLGFRLAGIRKIWHTQNEVQLERAVREAQRDADISILVMQTQDLKTVPERLRDELNNSVKPTVVAVGEEDDNTLRQKIKQAVGVDLW